MSKIREITITDYTLNTIIGYDGEHKITNLNIKLPAEMISGDIDYYTVEFETSAGDIVPSGHLSQSGGYIVISPWQQVMIEGTLKFQVIAWGLTGDTIDKIAKSPVISRLVGESVDGDSVLIDEEVSGLMAELQALIANYPVIMGTFTEGSAWDFELVAGALNITYVPAVNGVDGMDGENGSATVSIGTVITGTPASVTNSGTSTAAILDFVIPAGADGTDGEDGAAATVSVGTVSTGSPEAVVNVGTSSAAVFDFTIPAGEQGTAGTNGRTWRQGDSPNYYWEYSDNGTDWTTTSIKSIGTNGTDGTNGVDLTLPPIVAYTGTLGIGNSYTLTTGSNPTFTLPTVTDATKINQFRIEIKATSALTVTWVGNNLRAGAVAHVYGIGNHVVIGTWSTIESKWLLDAQAYGGV